MFELLAISEKGIAGQGIRGVGPLGLEGKDAGSAIPLFVNIMSTIIGVLTICAILWFIIQFLLGAFRWITSSGDAKAVEGARMQLIHSVIGLVLVFGTMIIFAVIGTVFGIDLLDLQKLITNVGIKK